MGRHEIDGAEDEAVVRAFTKAVLADIEALETLLERDMVERGVRRMGVEQEMFLVDAAGRPAPCSTEVLARLQDPRFKTELARFNLEVNLEPRPLDGACLRALEGDLKAALEQVSSAAAPLGVDVLLTGILPTLQLEDLGIENLTPELRYTKLNHHLTRMRGGEFPVVIDGLDHFETLHDSVMLEGANTSLQLHLQVDPPRFAQAYNLAQLVTAPLLAAATNSPVLLGRRLWHETRVALFERSVDGRSRSQLVRGLPSRVGFGEHWVEDSVLELLRENIARHRVILTCGADPDPFARIDQGMAPDLPALALHNGTVWRWNRPCYGVSGGRAHIRIENRVLPAGPSIVDEVANAALFYGMMLGLADTCADVSARMPFDDVRANFVAAAQHGIEATFSWVDGRTVPAHELLLHTLLPAARAGLADIGVPAGDIDHYLGVIDERVQSRRTGSRWLLDALDGHRHDTPYPIRATTTTAALLRGQRSGAPVHRWASPSAAPDEAEPPRSVADIMTRDVFTVSPEDVADLATAVMRWKHIRHVPVEDASGALVGLLTPQALLRGGGRVGADASLDVASLMERNPPTVSPETPLLDAMRRLLDGDSGCLLVTAHGQLLGIVTERDFVRAALPLLAAHRPAAD